MGKGGRIVCIFTPYVLTIASLICIIMVGLGCTKSSSSTLNDLYFFRANLKNITSEASSTVSTVSSVVSDLTGVSDGDLSAALEEIEEQYNIEDFYAIGLWGYCEGNITSNNSYQTSNCSKPEAEFWFNPMEVWNLEETGLENALPSNVKSALNTYKAVSKWMFIAYVIAFALTIVELVVGVFAICSRWGSCVTSLVSAVAFLFTAAASVTSTAMFAVLKGVFKSDLEQYGIKGQMGKNIYVATWLAVAFSLGATLFWIISSCCCSGRSPYNHRNRNRAVMAEKTPYTYEALGPHGQTQPIPYTNTSYPPPPPIHNNQTTGRTNAYEPFRHA
ncbi:integral membrane protein [Aspergillus costaricaensis CBS 115574]|uniref:Integral membrane protein n=1 Tax=Aspergillus costaricaensis CBS 115574 TaxID=1448317 RepID=A0ACD1IQ51_9EURO|nr:integral membrane protein [Aspergillus costaricaensis CBS 115574]RAK92233.1 integral membrane protein [Aspergillus costaricaensis CBS 115574]